MRYLVVFGTENYNLAIQSLVETGRKYFDYVKIFSYKDMSDSFLEENHKILTQKRGAGYWLWKPYFIDLVLNQINYDDILFYVDAGNIFINDPNILYNRLNKNDGILLFDNRDSLHSGDVHKNITWTKRDCFHLMNLDEKNHLYNTHCNAAYQIYKKTKKSIDFVKEMLFWSKDEKILTDLLSTESNYPDFIEHRHDQSILSLLVSKYDLNLEIDPSEWGNICGLRDYPQLFIHHRNPNYNFKN